MERACAGTGSSAPYEKQLFAANLVSCKYTPPVEAPAVCVGTATLKGEASAADALCCVNIPELAADTSASSSALTTNGAAQPQRPVHWRCLVSSTTTVLPLVAHGGSTVGLWGSDLESLQPQRQNSQLGQAAFCTAFLGLGVSRRSQVCRDFAPLSAASQAEKVAGEERSG